MQSNHWVLMSCLFAVFGCSSGTGADEPLGASRNDLFLSDGVTLWNSASSAHPELLGGGATIPVCFAVRPLLDTAGVTTCPNMTDATRDCDGNTTNTAVDPNGPVTLNQAVLRPFIRGVMEDTWSRTANIEFTGWGDCTISASGKHEMGPNAGKIMILFTTGDVSGLGQALTQPNIVSYNWAWQMRLATNNPGPATLYNTIHEFGHALGFAHEWARADYPLPAGCTVDAGEGVVGGYSLTPTEDMDSIMDKCAPLTFQNLLSAGDNWGAQMAYGSRVKGVLPLGIGWSAPNVDSNTVANATSRAESVAGGYNWRWRDGWIFEHQAPQTVPLQHYWSATRTDNFVTATTAGINDAIAAGYTFMRTEGYVYPTQQPGTVPLKLYFHAPSGDNLTTSNPDVQTIALSSNYTFIRTEGYVFDNLPYTVGRWYQNSALGDHVSSAADGAFVKYARRNGWVARGADAAYMLNSLPGTVAATTFFSNARGDYYTTTASSVPGYSYQQAEGYLFSSQYDPQDVAPLTTYWNSGAQDYFTTNTGAATALASGYTSVAVRGYGLAPMRDVATATLYDSWETLPGAALDIGAADDTAWIIGSNNTIFKWDPAAKTWTQSNGIASRIAVQADGVPWVVDANGSIFQRTTNSAASGNWTQRAGCAKDIGVGIDGSVWIVGCSAVNGGYGMFKWNGLSWTMDATGGGATRIAVDSTGKPWIVNSNFEIFKRSSNDPNNGSWTMVSGGARDIGVGPAGYPWIIGTSSTSGGYNVFAWDDQAGTWVSVPGGATQISVGRNGRPWMTNSNGAIVRAYN